MEIELEPVKKRYEAADRPLRLWGLGLDRRAVKDGDRIRKHLDRPEKSGDRAKVEIAEPAVLAELRRF